MTWVGWIKIWGNFALLFEIFIFTAKLCCFLSRFAIQTLLRFPSRARLCFEISTQGKIVLWVKKIRRRKRIVLHGKCLSPSGVVSSILSLQRSQVGGGCIGRKHRNPRKLPFVSHSTKLGQLPLNQFFVEKGFPNSWCLHQILPTAFLAIASFSPFPEWFCVLRLFTASLPRHCLSEKHQ